MVHVLCEGGWYVTDHNDLAYVFSSDETKSTHIYAYGKVRAKDCRLFPTSIHTPYSCAKVNQNIRVVTLKTFLESQLAVTTMSFPDTVDCAGGASSCGTQCTANG